MPAKETVDPRISTGDVQCPVCYSRTVGKSGDLLECCHCGRAFHLADGLCRVGDIEIDASHHPDEKAGYNGEICCDCDLPVARGIGTYWRANDELWERVVGELVDPALILCPACFAERAHKRGLLVWWEAALDDRQPSDEKVHAANCATRLNEPGPCDCQPSDEKATTRGRLEGALSVLEAGGDYNREGLTEILKETVEALRG